MIKAFVFDTNSLTSANLSLYATNRKAYDNARIIGIPIYLNDTLTELFETLVRFKFDRYISLENCLLKFYPRETILFKFI